MYIRVGENVTLQGACQVHVNEEEGVSLYVQDFIPVTGVTNIADIINQEIFIQVFRITVMRSRATVTDKAGNHLISITSNTQIFEISFVSSVTYSPLLQTISFLNTDNSERLIISNIRFFTVFVRNELQVFDSSLNLSEITIQLSNDGVLYVDNDTVLFISNSNPTVRHQLDSAMSSVAGTYTYSIETDSTGVYSLVATKKNTTSLEISEVIQILTGALLFDVSHLQSISYINDEVVIHGADGTPLTRLVLISRLVVNSENSFVSYFGVSSVPFSGPGIITANRGKVFFTTDISLIESLSSVISTAPTPITHFEKVTVTFNEIDGIMYTIGAVQLRIGSDLVAVYEATSYKTNQEQVIVYSNARVTVHQFISVRSVAVSSTSNQLYIVYTNENGDTQVLPNIEILYIFSGADIQTFTLMENTTFVGPGKLYISQNGMELLLTTSEIITSDVADLIRQLVPSDFSIDADQYSSVTDGVYQLSIKSALLTHIGGGILWYSVFNETQYSFYLNDNSLRMDTLQTVSTLLGITKSAHPKDSGILRIIFNGQAIYSYLAVQSNFEIHIRNTDSFLFNTTTLFGASLPGGPYHGIEEVVSFDGMEVKVFESNNDIAEIVGPGLLLIQPAAGTAFFTNWPATINFILQSISILRQYLHSPELEQPIVSSMKIKERFATVEFGIDVRAYEGSTITFVCSVTKGIPLPNIMIFRLDPSGPTLLVVTNDTMNSTLILTNIDESVSGEYGCRADNGVPPVAEATSRLNVREAGNNRTLHL